MSLGTLKSEGGGTATTSAKHTNNRCAGGKETSLKNIYLLQQLLLQLPSNTLDPCVWQTKYQKTWIVAIVLPNSTLYYSNPMSLSLCPLSCIIFILSQVSWTPNWMLAGSFGDPGIFIAWKSYFLGLHVHVHQS